MQEVCCISGVAGMTGSKVAEFLLKQDIIVVGFDNFFCGSRLIIEQLKAYNNFIILF